MTKDMTDTVKTDYDFDVSSPSRLDSRTDERFREKLSRRQSLFRLRESDINDDKRKTILSTSSKERYDSPSEAEA